MMSPTAEHMAGQELMALVDGELSGAELRAAEQHLASCAVCADEVASLREGARTLRLWTVEPVPDGIASKVLAYLGKQGEHNDREPEAAVPPRQAGRHRAPWWVWGGSGAVAAGALAALLVVGVGGRAARPYRYAASLQSPGAPAVDAVVAPPPVKSAAASPAPLVEERAEAAPPAVGGLPEMKMEAPASAAQRMLAAPSQRARLGGPSSPPPVQALDAPMIARIVDLTITVKDVERAREALDNLLRAYNGYAAQMEVSTPDDGQRTLHASLRVPAGQMRGMLAELKGYGKVESETQSGEEVGQEHADLVARLNTSRESEERLRGILKTRTGDVSEVLEVEQEIARVRGEIESMEAEQQALEHRVSYSTIDLQLQEQGERPATRTVASRLAAGARQGWANATEAVVGLMLFVLEYGLAIVLIAALLGVPAWILWKRWRRVRARW